MCSANQTSQPPEACHRLPPPPSTSLTPTSGRARYPQGSPPGAVRKGYARGPARGSQAAGGGSRAGLSIGFRLMAVAWLWPTGVVAMAWLWLGLFIGKLAPIILKCDASGADTVLGVAVAGG